MKGTWLESMVNVVHLNDLMVRVVQHTRPGMISKFVDMMIAVFLDVEINGLHPGLHLFGLMWMLLVSGKRR